MAPERLCMGCMEDRGERSSCPRCGYREGTPPKTHLYLDPRTIIEAKYMIGRVLGYGGFGITYIAWDLPQSRKLAIKEYLPNGLATRGAGSPEVALEAGQDQEDFLYGLKQFLDEGRTLARFQMHPGIVQVLDYVRANGTAYLVMEYLPGMNFEEMLVRYGGRIRFDQALNIMTRVMDALREVHRDGILHRDVAPDNIAILPDGRVKLFDFGAARHAVGQRSRHFSVVLKEGYAPLEQYSSKAAQGPWTDVYATAATFYRAITGRVPPPAMNRQDRDDLQAPSRLRIPVPPHGETALLKALAVRAQDRYASMEGLQAALTNQPEDVFLGGAWTPRLDATPVPLPPAWAPEGRRKRLPHNGDPFRVHGITLDRNTIVAVAAGAIAALLILSALDRFW